MTPRPTRICAVQIDPRLADAAGNTERIDAEIRAAAGEGAALSVFPEAAVTGYVFESPGEARAAAIAADGPELARLAGATRDTGSFAVVGAIEVDGDALYNSAFLLGPEGIVGRYRKVHTLCLGVDRFTRPGGEPFRTWSLPFGRVGLHICYDGTFPESARSLRLEGAELLILPTNWPRLHMKREMVKVRAYENRAFYLAVNRVGTERGVRFDGGSMLADMEGDLLLEAGAEAGRFHAEIDLARAAVSREVVRPGEYELDLIEDRQPETYAAITRPLEAPRRTGSHGAA